MNRDEQHTVRVPEVGLLNVIIVDLSEGVREDFSGRQWFEQKVEHGQLVGWDMEWDPDRSAVRRNPIALIQDGAPRTQQDNVSELQDLVASWLRFSNL